MIPFLAMGGVGFKGEWSAVGSAYSISPSPSTPGIDALSSSRIALYGSGGDRLGAYEFNGSSWSQVGNLLTVTNDGATWLATIAANRVAISCGGSSAVHSVQAYDFDGTNWSSVGSAASHGSTDGDAAICKVGTNQIALALNFPSGELSQWSFNGSSWTKNGTQSIDASTPDLAYLEDGAVVHWYSGGGGSLRKKTYSGGSWSNVGNVLTGTGAGSTRITAMSPTRIARLDPSGDTLISYDFDGTDWAASSTPLSISSLGSNSDICALTSKLVAVVDSSAATIQAYKLS